MTRTEFSSQSRSETAQFLTVFKNSQGGIPLCFALMTSDSTVRSSECPLTASPSDDAFDRRVLICPVFHMPQSLANRGYNFIVRWAGYKGPYRMVQYVSAIEPKLNLGGDRFNFKTVA